MVSKLLVISLIALVVWAGYYYYFLPMQASIDSECEITYQIGMQTGHYPDWFSPEQCDRAEFFVNTPKFFYWLILSAILFGIILGIVYQIGWLEANK